MSLLPALAPWQQRAYAQAIEAIDAGRFGHATLIVGPALIGKRVLAEHLAARVLCQRPTATGAPCGACKGCMLFASRAQYEPVEIRPDGTPSHPWGHSAHPDLLLVGYAINAKSGKPRGEIVIDQMRGLSEKLALTAQLDGAQVAIVDPADAINWNAFNALLKTLEEPQPGRYLWLLSSNPARLPATIRSRCQRLEVRLPPREEALAWLGQRGQAVPGEVAQRWVAGEHASECLRHLADLALQQAAGLTDPAATRTLAARFDAANRARDLLRSTVRADLAVAESLLPWCGTANEPRG